MPCQGPSSSQQDSSSWWGHSIRRCGDRSPDTADCSGDLCKLYGLDHCTQTEHCLELRYCYSNGFGEGHWNGLSLCPCKWLELCVLVHAESFQHALAKDWIATFETSTWLHLVPKHSDHLYAILDKVPFLGSDFFNDYHILYKSCISICADRKISILLHDSIHFYRNLCDRIHSFFLALDLSHCIMLICRYIFMTLSFYLSMYLIDTSSFDDWGIICSSNILWKDLLWHYCLRKALMHFICYILIWVLYIEPPGVMIHLWKWPIVDIFSGFPSEAYFCFDSSETIFIGQKEILCCYSQFKIGCIFLLLHLLLQWEPFSFPFTWTTFQCSMS